MQRIQSVTLVAVRGAKTKISIRAASPQCPVVQTETKIEKKKKEKENSSCLSVTCPIVWSLCAVSFL